MGKEGILSGYSTLTNVSVEVRCIPGEETSANIVLDSLSSGMDRVTGYFGLSSFPFVQAVLVPDRSEFARLVRECKGGNVISMFSKDLLDFGELWNEWIYSGFLTD